MSDYELVRSPDGHLARFTFDAGDLRAIAACLPVGDTGAAEMRAAADELDRVASELDLLAQEGSR